MPAKYQKDPAPMIYTSADDGKEMKKSESSGKQKPTKLNSSTGAKPKKKAQKKSTDKREKSLSEEEMEDLWGELAMIYASFSHVMRRLHEISTQRAR